MTARSSAAAMSQHAAAQCRRRWGPPLGEPASTGLSVRGRAVRAFWLFADRRGTDIINWYSFMGVHFHLTPKPKIAPGKASILVHVPPNSGLPGGLPNQQTPFCRAAPSGIKYRFSNSSTGMFSDVSKVHPRVRDWIQKKSINSSGLLSGSENVLRGSAEHGLDGSDHPQAEGDVPPPAEDEVADGPGHREQGPKDCSRDHRNG